MIRKQSGFTLVELSIVLVILGLLVGGVLAGQSLIHASELRSINKEFTGLQTAVNAFREKYMALPGDMPNAVKFWGAAAGGTTDGTDAACLAVATAATGTETCNGNGDGQIGGREKWRGFEEMAAAGMIEGNYSGVHGPGDTSHDVPGTNVPRSKYPGSGWGLIYKDFMFTAYAGWQTGFNNVFYFGGTYDDAPVYKPILLAEDAYNVDVKMDDGKPNTGIVQARPNSELADCVVATDDAYALSDTTQGCWLNFKSGF